MFQPASCGTGQYEERFNFSSFGNGTSIIKLLPPSDGKQYTAIEYACVVDEEMMSAWIYFTDGDRTLIRMYTTDSTTVDTGHTIDRVDLYTSTYGGGGTISKFLFK